MQVYVNGRAWKYSVEEETVIVISPKKKKIKIEIKQVSRSGNICLSRLKHYLASKCL